MKTELFLLLLVQKEKK
ncbi:hypothetical protein CGSSp6BS73_00777 [Streptococcus pneumoniae SP6-BS73]|nr:hypothetical protein CGSSp6BS73_00777 [Streptococcus pneumoniae SP6-BS73]